MAKKSKPSSRTGNGQPEESALEKLDLNLASAEKHTERVESKPVTPSVVPADQDDQKNGKPPTATKDTKYIDSPPGEELGLVAQNSANTSEITLHTQPSHAASFPLHPESVTLVINGTPPSDKSLAIGLEDLSGDQKKRRAEDAMNAARLKEVTIPTLFKVIIPSAATLLLICDFINLWSKGTDYSLIGQLTRLLQTHSSTIDWRVIIPALTAGTGIGAYAGSSFQKRKVRQSQRLSSSHPDDSREQ